MNADRIMKTTAKPPKHDWSRFGAMTEAQRNAAATHDPDAVPLTPADFKRMKRTPQVKMIRGKFSEVSLEQLMRFLTALGYYRD